MIERCLEVQENPHPRLNNMIYAGVFSVGFIFGIFLGVLLISMDVFVLGVLGIYLPFLARIAGVLVVMVFGMFIFGFSGADVVKRGLLPWLSKEEDGSDKFFCELTFRPRRSETIKTLMDTSDDVGLLMVEEDRLVFKGDRYTFEVPREYVLHVSRKGLFTPLFAKGALVDLDGVKGIEQMSFLPMHFMCAFSGHHDFVERLRRFAR